MSSQPYPFGPNRYFTQFHSSNNDNVHSATLREMGTGAVLGCFVVREDTQQWMYWQQLGIFYDECQVDKSGQWLVIKEKVSASSNDVDNRVIELSTGRETVLHDQDGNLVRSGGGLPPWSSGTQDTSPGQAVMQGDGNLVVQDNAGTPLCATRTDGNPGAYLRVLNDGHLVIYSTSGAELWRTGECYPVQ